MIRTNVILLAVPDSACIAERLDLRVLMNRSLKIEERMKKGVNLEDEQRRYQILCDRIEYLGNIIVSTQKVESVDLGENYLDLLLLMQKKNPEDYNTGRIMANFCPAERAEKQISQFEDLAMRAGILSRVEIGKKSKFYRSAAKKKCHILEIQDMTISEEPDEVILKAGLKDEFLSIPMSDNITSARDISSLSTLRNQIRQVIANQKKKIPASVNFSDLPHNTITETLHEFVYGSGTPTYLPVTYDDGSKASPFPIHCLKLPKIDQPVILPGPVLNVGQLSGRHQEMDENINIYFFRNQEISTGKTAGEIDEVAYQKAKEIFERLRREGIYRIAYYQTGFQPAVVGFYRALTEELLLKGKKAPVLEVTPYYFFGHYEKGKVWI